MQIIINLVLLKWLRLMFLTKDYLLQFARAKQFEILFSWTKNRLLSFVDKMWYLVPLSLFTFGFHATSFNRGLLILFVLEFLVLLREEFVEGLRKHVVYLLCQLDLGHLQLNHVVGNQSILEIGVY